MYIMSASKKRVLDDASGVPKSKKKKTDHSSKSNGTVQKAVTEGTTLLSEEVDFPRGGGTSFTPLELKAIRAEGVKEAEKEIFKVTTPTFEMHSVADIHLLGCSREAYKAC